MEYFLTPTATEGRPVTTDSAQRLHQSHGQLQFGDLTTGARRGFRELEGTAE
jgi:hypothetical protein